MGKNKLQVAILNAILLMGGTLAYPATAYTQDQALAYRIDAGDLENALSSFGTQSRIQLIYPPELLKGKRSGGLSGNHQPMEALRRLLQGSGLEAERVNDRTVVIKRTSAQTTEPPAATRNEPATTQPAEPEIQDLGVVAVTGTLIKGIAPESSPLQIFTSVDILESGASSTEDFLRRSVLQNFSGGSTEYIQSGLPNDNNSRMNNTFSTGANLRGLGSSATLTLLNGNRMAPTSQIGDFVDLSIIPVTAIERVEVLSDGASSIYGGDAVAGVINFVLRDDFDGAETSVRYGTVTRGNMNEFRVSQTLGAAWERGHGLAVYEFSRRDNLSLNDRRSIAAPTTYDGEPIPYLSYFDLLPEQSKHSGLLSASQQVGPRLGLSGTALYSRRESKSYGATAAATSSALISDVRVDSIALGGKGDYEISPGWELSLGGNYSRRRDNQFGQMILPTEDEPYEYKTNSSVWSADALLNGVLFSLPGGSVRAGLGTQYREERFDYGNVSEPVKLRDGGRRVAALFGEVHLPLIGPENPIPGVRRLEINASGRWDDYSDFGDSINPKVGLLWAPTETLKIRGSYSTSFAPPSLGRVAATDRYGIVLPYDYIRNLLGLDLPDPSLAGVDYLQVAGTSANLEPETSRTFTAGVDYAADLGGGALSLQATYYDIKFKNRLNTTPLPDNVAFGVYAVGLAFHDPDLFPGGTFQFFPGDQEVADLVSTFNQPVRYVYGASSLDNIGFIDNVAVTRNLALTRTNGIDLQARYSHDLGFGTAFIGLYGNYIFNFTKQAAVTTPAVETLNTLYNPVDLRIRGNAGVSVGGLNANIFVNYTDGYRTDDTDSSSPIASWTTVDMSLTYRFPSGSSAILKGTTLSASVTNLLNKAPPMTPTDGTLRLTGFDPTNASALGRFVAFELRKAF